MFFECTPVQIHNAGLIFSLFIGGLVGGWSHCTLMCAPFVLSLQQKQLGRVASVLLLPYHLGRLTTYVFLGCCSYLLLAYAFPVSEFKRILSAAFLVMAALLFWVQAVPVLWRYMPFLMRFHIPISLCSIQTQLSKLHQKQNYFTLYLTGVLLGFIPCGLVMGALLAVSTASSLYQAMFGMMAFAIGTTPSLIVVAMSGKALATFFPTGGALFSRWGLVINGVILLILAGLLLT